MSITKGMGEYWGNYLVAVPFRLRLIRWIKKIIKKLIRVIPWRRKRFKVKIPVKGDLVVKSFNTFQIQGFPFITQTMKIQVKSNVSCPSSFNINVSGFPFSKIEYSFPIIGDYSILKELKLDLIGNLSTTTSVNLVLKGERDIRKQLWLILEDEE